MTVWEIQTALQSALADRHIKIKTHRNKDELIVVVNRTNGIEEINYPELTHKIGNILLSMQVNGINRFKIFGRLNDLNYPEWQGTYKIYSNRSQNNINKQQYIQESKELNIETVKSNIAENKFKIFKHHRIRLDLQIMPIKIILAFAGGFSFFAGLSILLKAINTGDEILGSIVLLIAVVLVVGLAIVHSIDILRQEIQAKN